MLHQIVFVFSNNYLATLCIIEEIMIKIVISDSNHLLHTNTLLLYSNILETFIPLQKLIKI